MPFVASEVFSPVPVTVVVASGPVTAGEIRDAARDLLRTNPNRLVLWDGIEADVSPISLKDLYGLFRDLKPLIEVREGGRTALLTGSTGGFGIGRWISTQAENAGFPYPLRVFKERAAAMAWLTEKETDPAQLAG